MPVEFTPPKYAVVANTIQQRIVDGVYPPGAKLPSESQLTQEFHASRPMVVRALEILKRDGWIESYQGKGRYVLARQAAAGRQLPGYVGELLDETQVKLLSAGPLLASERVASALAVPVGTPVIARKRLLIAQIGPVELSSVYVPVELAAGSDIGKDIAITGGLLAHLEQVKGARFDHATQRISARHASSGEARLLDITRREVVLTLLVTIFDRAGAAQMCVDAALPVSRHELEDVFPLT